MLQGLASYANLFLNWCANIISEPWFGYAVWAAALWAFIGVIFFGARVREHPNSRPNLKIASIIFGPLLITVAILLPFLALAALTFILMGAQWLLDPHQFWLALPLIAIAWFFGRRSQSALSKVVAGTLQPWLLGMTIIGVTFLAARAWLPQAQWSWIFSLEEAASWCEVALNEILPDSLFANLALLAIFFTLNVLHPTWKEGTRRFQKALAFSKAAVAVLAIFTSFTFFGAEQAGVLLEATATEKYARLMDQSTASAQLILTARLSQDVKTESQNAKEFLDAIFVAVSMDLKMPPSPEDISRAPAAISSDELNTWRLNTLVAKRVSELREAMAESPVVVRVARTIDISKLASMLGHIFTEDEIKEAEEQFTEALNEFVEKGADLSTHPLSQMLAAAHLPELAQSVIKDLYVSEVSDLSKAVTTPLADSLYRIGSAPAEAALASLSQIAERPAFDPLSLPAKVVTPTFEDRFSDKTIRDEAVERAKDVDEIRAP